MTNKQFADTLKENQYTRSDQAVNDIRQALKEIGVKTSAYNARIDPHSAAWLTYAALMAPTYRASAKEWIKQQAAAFHRKKVLNETTPIDILWSLFEDPKSADVLDRVVINSDTGDLYAIAKDGRGDVAYSVTNRTANNRKPTLIQFQVQIDGEYFRHYHRMTAKMN